MIDVTEFMDRYRECARILWNVYFSAVDDRCRAEDFYEQTKTLLFEALVLSQCEHISGRPVSLSVVPFNSVTVLVKRPSADSNHYWDETISFRKDEANVQLIFVDYYDFFEHRPKDFRFYRCRVVKCTDHAEYEGREALVDVADATIVFAESTDRNMSV